MGGCIGKLCAGGAQARTAVDRKGAAAAEGVPLAPPRLERVRNVVKPEAGGQPQGTDIRDRSCGEVAGGKVPFASASTDELRMTDFKHSSQPKPQGSAPSNPAAPDQRSADIERLRTLLSAKALGPNERATIDRVFERLNRATFRMIEVSPSVETDHAPPAVDALLDVLLDVYHQCSCDELPDAASREDLVHSLVVKACGTMPQELLLTMVRRLHAMQEPGPQWAGYLLMGVADATVRSMTTKDALVLYGKLEAWREPSQADRDAWRMDVIQGVLRPDRHNGSLREPAKQTAALLASAMEHLETHALLQWLPDILDVMDLLLDKLSPAQRAGFAGFVAGLALAKAHNSPSGQIAVTAVERGLLAQAVCAYVERLGSAASGVETKSRSSSSATEAARDERMFAMLHGWSCGTLGDLPEKMPVPGAIAGKLAEVAQRLDGKASSASGQKVDARHWRLVLSNLMLERPPSKSGVAIVRAQLGEAAYHRAVKDIGRFVSVPAWALPDTQ